MHQLDDIKVARSVLAGALRVAADEYTKAAQVLVEERGHDRVVEQFERQAAEARALADKVEQSDIVHLHD